MIPAMNSQRGAVLFVALVMLVLLTMLAVSSINLSTTNLRVVGNMQAQKYLDNAVEGAIEQVISNSNAFTSPAATTISTSMGDVTVTKADCLGSQTASGYSAVITNIIPDDNTFEIIASGEDSVSGATSVIHQGIQIRMLAGNCP